MSRIYARFIAHVKKIGDNNSLEWMAYGLVQVRATREVLSKPFRTPCDTQMIKNKNFQLFSVI